MQRTNPLFYFFTGFILLLLLISAIFLFYHKGYRISGFDIVKVGNLEIATFQKNARVYIDGKLQVTTNTNEETYFFRNIVPGIHQVVIAKEGFWPWKKQVTVLENTTTALSSFSFPLSVNGIPIQRNSPEFYPILSLIEENYPPTKDFPITSSDKKVALWTEASLDGRTSIKAKWQSAETLPLSFCNAQNICEKEIEVISIKEPIKSIAFYRDRNDVFMFASKQGIYGIEIEKTGGQNFQPFYSGNNPYFLKKDINSFYLKDAGSLFLVSF